MSGQGISRARRCTMSNWIADSMNYFDIIGSNAIYCRICLRIIQCRQKSDYTRHLSSKTHKETLNPPLSLGCFNQELCEAFLAANIPLVKLKNPLLKKVLEKYTKKHIPDESTLRKYYVPKLYEKVFDLIKENLSGQYVWISADETTDTLGRCVVHVIIGTLSKNMPYVSYLIATKICDEINAVSMTKIIKESLDNIFDYGGLQYNRVLLFISDATAHMLETGKLLKDLYRNMMHITCVLHALHRVCKFIRDEFDNVDKLIDTFKKVFHKGPLRIALYKKKFASLPLPPAPEITEWESWVEASIFYSQNFCNLQHFLSIVPSDTRTIIKCKELMQTENLQQQLKIIETHFQDLTVTKQYFEIPNAILPEALKILNETLIELKSISGNFGDRLKQKIDAVFQQNPDIQTLQQLFITSSENVICDRNIFEKYARLLPNFTYAPLTNCDVKETFSVLHDVLTSQRTYFTEEHLEKALIINVNSFLLS